MVNWCENEITISGDRDMIERLWSLMQARNEFLNVLYPRPERIKANDPDVKEKICSANFVNMLTEWLQPVIDVA